MIKDLLRFEWYYHTRRPLFYIASAVFAIMGFLIGYSGGIFPNVHINSPYQVSYLTGVLSLAAIFLVTLLVAQSFLREKETRFDAVLYATPAKKFSYLFSRVGAAAFVAIFSFTMSSVGMVCGQLLSVMPPERVGDYHLLNYAWPLLVLAVPNIILCLAVLCGTAWLTRSKLAIYVAGLLIYVLYIIASIFANSPLMAGSAPSSPEAMSLFAKLDPLGMAAFFEQTKYWTAHERNTLQLSLSGNLLFNRALWMGIAAVVIAVAYASFSFRKLNAKPVKKKREGAVDDAAYSYKPVAPAVHTWRHNYASVISFCKIDVIAVSRSIPFLLVVILWTALLGIEMMNAVQGDARLGERYATTGLMVTTIMDMLPFFTLLVILFFSSELLWRSKAVNIYAVESTTPVNSTSVFVSKLISLSVIPVFLVAYSCLVGMIVQGGKIEFGLYASVFYYTGLPLVLCIVLVASIQAAVKNKYAGLFIATVVVLLSSSNVGSIIGIRYPLLRYANALQVKYEDMNGFGAYTTAFNWQMLCWGALAVCMITKRKLRIISGLVFLASAAYIVYQVSPYQTQKDVNDWKQSYENNFKRYQHLPQPSITSVKAAIDLYPAEQRYTVNGEYKLVNNSSRGIDSLLLNINRNIRLGKVVIQNAHQAQSSFYIMNKTLQPGDTISMQFSFSSGWSPFKGHTPFNSIVDNGSFMRISNYFPGFGYESGNEISSAVERTKRKMKPQDELKKLAAPLDSPYNYGFITLDAVVSTAGDQVAVGSGELIKQWSDDGRNYFHYRSDRPMPFRFAFSSARYAVKKDHYKNIPIEIYYDARHAANVDSLISNAKNTLAYCESNFAPYPHKVVRFAEISAFAEGFAATAYPGVIYMKENGGFHNNLSRDNAEDIINQLAGHELSHQWWGSTQLTPDQREGAWILTETLAKYTELMLYEHAHGPDAALEIVREHLDQYFSNRSFSKEAPMYKTTYETAFIPYNKGTVVMHQLKQLIGEEAVNKALKSLLENHAFPKAPPTAQDLLNELHHPKVDELFKQIIIYDSKIENVQLDSIAGGWKLTFKASSQKFSEDGTGKRAKAAPDSTIDAGIYTADEKLRVQSFSIHNGIVTGTFITSKKPVRLILDPYIKTMGYNLAYPVTR